ncbi:MAG: peroxiredoxin family protein [Planctomycetota bacterium]|jgi:peroxiredoxin
MKKTIFVTIAFSVVAAALFNGCKSKEQSDKDTGTRKAPYFTLKNYDDKTVQLSDYKGQIVVLEWFNYDCPFSKYHYDKASTMINLAKKYKNKNVVWLAINSTNFIKAEQNEEYAKKHNIPYPILDDTKGTVGHAFDAQTTPHIFIIDTNLQRCNR